MITLILFAAIHKAPKALLLAEVGMWRGQKSLALGRWVGCSGSEDRYRRKSKMRRIKCGGSDGGGGGVLK